MPKRVHTHKAKVLAENLGKAMIRDKCRDFECLHRVFVQIEIVSERGFHGNYRRAQGAAGSDTFLPGM